MLERFLISIYHFLQALGPAGIFASMFTENIGIPLPTEIGYVIAWQLIAAEKLSYTLAMVILTAGHLSGSLISWQLGRWGGTYTTRRLMGSQRFLRTRERLEKWYARYGNATVFLTRFVGYVRPWASFVAGFAKVGFWPFVTWTFLGSLIFNIICLQVTGLLVAGWRRYSEYHLPIAVLLFFTFFGFLIYEVLKLLRESRQRRNSG